MHRISVLAIVVAFLAELAADWVIQLVLLLVLGSGTLGSDMNPEDFQKAVVAIGQTPAFITAVLIFGTGTTLGGAYLAARLAKRFPYYHGLAMGLVGIAYVLYYWRANALWMNVVAVLSNIPVSLLGAHLAKPHLPPPE